jgi:hypothetical protein
MVDSICIRLTLLSSGRSMQPCIHSPASGHAADMRRSQGVTASANDCPAAGTGRPRPPAVRQASNSAATCEDEAARAAASGAICRWSPARARCRAARPWRTSASHPAARAPAATRCASRPRPSASAAPRTSPHAAPQVLLVRQARSTRAPPGGGVIALILPAPRSATTAWADTPLGPSQVRTAPAPASHDAGALPAAGRQRRMGAARPRAPAVPRCACATAGEMGTSPGGDGPLRRRDRAPNGRSANRSASVTRRTPAAASTSAAASTIPADQFALPAALSSTVACTCAPGAREPRGSSRTSSLREPTSRDPSGSPGIPSF